EFIRLEIGRFLGGACPEGSRRVRSNNMHHLVQIWFQWVEQWGYLGIILLMAMESSIFPVPSEIVIPPAAFLATEGKLSMFGVIAAGTIGSSRCGTATPFGGLLPCVGVVL